MKQSDEISVQQIQDILFSLTASSAVMAAHHLNIFKRLEKGPVQISKLVKELSLGTRGAQTLMKTLSGLGLTELTKNGFCKARYSQANFIDEILKASIHLSEMIQKDKPRIAGNRPEHAESIYAQFIGYCDEFSKKYADVVANALASPGQHILDLGAGTAPYSSELALREPKTQVTAVDLPKVIKKTRGMVQKKRINSQFKFLPGDVFKLDLPPQAYDLVLLANLSHLFGENNNKRLLKTALLTLRPGGKLALIDVLSREVASDELFIRLYNLNLFTRTERGKVYPYSEYKQWLREVGFKRVTKKNLGGNPSLFLITAHRPK